jgi:hypothetical protein
MNELPDLPPEERHRIRSEAPPWAGAPRPAADFHFGLPPATPNRSNPDASRSRGPENTDGSDKRP